MLNQREILEAEALKLPMDERVALAQLLLASLDEDGEFEQAWAIEAERRLNEIESGVVQTIALEDVLSEVRAKLE